MKIENDNQAYSYAKENTAFDNAARIAVNEDGNVIYDPSDAQILNLKGKIYMVKGDMPVTKKQTNEPTIS